MERMIKKIVASVLAIALVVSGITIQPKTVKAKTVSETIDGVVYTVTDEVVSLIGFEVQGIFDKARIHFAWGSEVTADTIAAIVNGTAVTVDGKNAHGMYIPISEVKNLGKGEYAIEISATETSTGNKLIGKAKLVIQAESETTTKAPGDWADAGTTWTTDGVWNIYADAGGGASAQYKNNNTQNDYYVKVVTTNGTWSIQSKTLVSGLTAGTLYDYVITIESDKAGAYVGAKDDKSNSNLVYKTLAEGVNTIEGTFTAAGTEAEMFLEMGSNANNGATFHITGVEIKAHQETGEQTGNIAANKKWLGWFEEEGWANYEISDNSAGYTLTNKNIGANFYSIQTGLDNIYFLQNTNYTCAFTLTANKAKEFTVDNRSNDQVVFTEKSAGSWKDNGDGTYSYKYVGTFLSTQAQYINIRVSLGYHNNKDGKTDTNYASKETASFTLSDFVIMKTTEYEGGGETTTPEVTVPQETTTPTPGEPKWIKLADTTGGDGAMSYYYDQANMTVREVINVQQPPWATEKGIYMNVTGEISTISVNGVTTNVASIDGTGMVIHLSALTQEINEVVITHANGTSTVSIKKEKEETTTPEPTTVPEIVDGTNILQDTEFEEGNVSHWDEYGPITYTNKGSGRLDVSIPAYEEGDNWATQLVQRNLKLYKGKWYVAQFTITSDVDKSFQLLIQSDGNNGGDWTVFAEELVSVTAGETKTVQVQFQSTKTTDANVLYGIMMGYINGTASKAANVTIRDVSLAVYGSEQPGIGSKTLMLTHDDVVVTGFQMKTNWPDEDQERNQIGFRTVCKAPNIGGNITVGEVTYTVAKIGTVYTVEPDKNIPDGVTFDASCTLLKSYNVIDDTYEVANPCSRAFVATEEKGILEKNGTCSTYVQTMIGTIGQLHPGNKIHMRAFVVTTGGTIIYGKKSVSTSIARAAAYVYQKSLSSNYKGHEYLYEKILKVATFVPTENTDYIITKQNAYYRDTPLVYGWNDNLYTPDGEHYMNLKPDVYLGSDYIMATTGWDEDPASVNTNTRGDAISIAGLKFDYGIATNAVGYFEYKVPKNAEYFVGIVGVDDSVSTNPDYKNGATITCEVSFDGSIAATTKTLSYGELEYIKVAVPKGASVIRITFGDAGNGATCDRVSMGNAGWMIDKNAAVEDESPTYDMSKDPSDITRIYVFTDDANATITKNAKTPGSITIISGEGEVNSVSDVGTIKLRGNSTSLADKAAYNISFNTKQKVFANAATGKKWCLLANAYDKTLLRNKLAMDLGKALGNVDTPEEHYADLYLNGRLMGTYLISEPADNGRSGIEFNDEDDDEMMFELEKERVESDQTYYKTEVLGMRFVTADPEGLDTTTAKYTNWVNTLKTFETALKNTSSDDMLNYIDVDSFVDMYIVNELFQTVDFGYSSVKFYTKKNASGNPIIHAGCLWDFDLSSGNSVYDECRTLNTFRGQNVNEWFKYLMQNNTFKQKVIKKYTEMQPTIQNIYQNNTLGTNQIDLNLSFIENSKNRNYTPISEGGAGWSESKADSYEYTWAYGYTTLAPYSGYTYNQHVDYLRTWLKSRNEWICSQWGIN